MIKNECKGCDKRQVGCHSTCESYKAYRQELERVKANWKEYNDKEQVFIESVAGYYARLRKKIGKWVAK